jgi:hypothetical protein
MHTRIDAVAASAPGRLTPVEPIQPQRRAQEDHEGLAHEREPAASFSSRRDPGATSAYTPPADAQAVHAFVTPDPVAPALAEALAAEPWGHPMPQKALWEQAAAARTTTPQPVEAAVSVAASSSARPARDAGPAPEPTPVATTAAAPATPAAAHAAPVSPVWLTSLLKAR